MRSFMNIAVGLFMLVAVAKADEEKVPLDKVPKAVLEAMKARFSNAKLVSAEKETEDGKTIYEIAITNKDQKIEVTLTTDGKIVEIEKQIAAKDMPKAVTEALEAKYPKATYKIIEEIIKVKDEKEKLEYYEVLLVTAEKKKLEVAVTQEGKIIKEEDKSKEKDDGQKNQNNDGDKNNKNAGQKNQKDDGRKNQKDDGQKSEQRREKSPEGQEPRLFPPGIERLDLNESQKEKLTELRKEFQEKLEAAKNKLTEALEQAKNNQDRQKAEEANQVFRKEVAKLQEELHGQLQPMLSEEQKNRLAEFQRGQLGRRPGFELRILSQLDLSAEQREKVEKLVKESGEKQEAAQKKLQEGIEQAKQNQDREKAQELFKGHQQEMAKLHEDLHKNALALLTDEQKKKFAELAQRRGEGFPGPGVGQVLPPPIQERLGLTPEQREKIAKLQKETEAKLREILNEEQTRKLDELKKGGAPDRPRPRE